MANSALIEDLRKQFAENPRRVFARLANEYRKSGDLDVAIEICRAHVPLQPTYISGYIVLGQALFERGQPEEARTTFETALSLDPENLIALRQLGDIARASGDLDAARGWYHKLLEVDPQNDDIAAQLEALDAPTHSTAPATPVEASTVSWSDIHPDSETVTPLSTQAMQPTRPRFTIGVIPENLTVGKSPKSAPASAPDSAPAPSAPAAAAKEESRAPEPIAEESAVSATLPEFFGGFDRHSPTPPAATPVIQAVEHEGELTYDASEMSADSAEASLPELMDISDLAPADPEPSDADLPPITTTAQFSVPAMPTAPAAPAVPPATAAELATLFAGPELETPMRVDSAGTNEGSTASSAQNDSRTFEEEPYDPTVGRMLELSSRTSSDALLPDLMMTESGAELLREQGHIDQAIYVYRHLAAKNPDDTSYAQRIAALERGAHSSIPLIADISQEIISAAKNRPYSTQSIRTFFTSFAMRQPPGEAAGEGAETAQASSQSAGEPSAHSAPESHAPEPPAANEAEVEAAPEDTDFAASEAKLAHTTSFAVPGFQATAPEAPPAAPVLAPEPPEIVSDDDRSALETLFSGKPKAAATDERAAAALASAFSEEFTPESTGPAGQPTRAASDALSLDAVFQSSRARTEGEHRASQPTVSFDEFFANRENGSGGGGAEGASEAAVETASLGDDSQSDLELFHEWLDGLKK
jgi:tetratricopeptide (TPR) repeat protein